MNGTPALEPTSPESRFNQPEANGTLPFLAVGEIFPPRFTPASHDSEGLPNSRMR